MVDKVTDNKMFSRVRHKRSSENVMEQIMARIEEGTLKDGDKLDSERILAMEFGVSQPCVREALRALELMGVVRVERGKGAFVLDSNGAESRFNVWNKWAHVNSTEVMEILEVRSALEAKIVGLVCSRHTEVDFSEIEGIVENMRECAQTNPSNISLATKLDMRFHVLLAELSGNKLLGSLTAMVADLISIDRRAVLSREGRLTKSAEEHYNIVNALKRGDLEKALKAMEDHITNTKNVFADIAMLKGDNKEE